MAEALIFAIFVASIIIIIVYIMAISKLVEAAQMKGHYRNGAGVLWFLGIFGSPLILGLITASLPDRAVPAASSIFVASAAPKSVEEELQKRSAAVERTEPEQKREQGTALLNAPAAPKSVEEELSKRIITAERAEVELKKERGTALLKGTPSVGDIVSFGLYEQDGNTGNGREVITWRVLAVEGSRVLLISEKGLDCRRFNSSRAKGNDWSTSDLRAWLSGSFKGSAFSAEQQARIAEVTCLSVDEVDRYFSGDKDRICYPSDYAKAQGAWTSWSGSCCWWLRSPGSNGSEFAAGVYYDGRVYTSGYNVDNVGDAVRPALWVELSQ